ncbi:hypothetical protein QUF84_15960 [Fictibacillus enclensis]|uniref:Uncharacterized protein n=1 Tax=Fictibacillus enclensis TaxID=1017270 RepID=A0A0V8JF44_9BACL|nr:MULTISPECIES: hypothetical protein [Fictibacillus]KSU85537.1 hypothetical protein AS030_08585 [Fictibacillus enclensis]MDM5199470.1 hypothetical protein [Fictibacillus enclensis]MDM5338707.1 hypothetical protein [Fictibacillus enclensis]RXY98773.1 hypothetical protein DMO16_03250 [Fictibacillus sp. S7]WHY70204.1 hypothetical protein QNH15_14095 [Fictibacillus enclensis]
MIDVEMPENKLELLPAVFIFIIFVILAWMTVKFLKKLHERELKKAEEAEAKMKEYYLHNKH